MLYGLNVFVGGMGAGKSYGMTRQLWEVWDAGCMVLSPMTLFPPKKYAHLYKKISAYEIREIMQTDYWQHGKGKQIVLALDEGWIPFNSYVKTKLPLDVQVEIMSARKLGVNLYITAQRWGLVHLCVRGVVDRVFICQTCQFFKFIKLFRYIEFAIMKEGDDGKIESEPIKVPWFFNFWLFHWFKTRVARTYDTWEKITDMYPREFLADPFGNEKKSVAGT